MITSINTVMASSYRRSLKTGVTSFHGANHSVSKPLTMTQSPAMGIIKSFQQIPFLKNFLK